MVKRTFSLDWHRLNLANASAYLAQEDAALRRQQARVERIRAHVERSIAQIAAAERLGLTEFDPERFMSSKKGPAHRAAPSLVKDKVSKDFTGLPPVGSSDV